MKLTIRYEATNLVSAPCGAYTFVGDQCCYVSAKTFDEARALLLEKVKRVNKVVVPEPETVEVPL